ncbi:hypothetical protein ACHQM5_006273 [Ranunculus cassubicifolius]
MPSEISSKCSPSKKIRSTSMSTELALQDSESIIYLDELKPATPEIKTIRVRVVRLWKDYFFNDTNKDSRSNKSGIGLIIADEKGTFGNAKVTPLNEGRFNVETPFSVPFSDDSEPVRV